jgi:uroporphyrinogen-III synthase
MPCSNLGSQRVSKFMTDNEFNWKDAMMYQTVSSDLSDLTDVTYDVLVFFSPLGIKSLFENFPTFEQNDTRMAIYGKSTEAATIKEGLTVNILAPAPEAPSMTMALKRYLSQSNK